jgi:ribosomal protein S12 methylthiotransferase accessory factor
MTNREVESTPAGPAVLRHEATHRLFPPEETLLRVVPFMKEAGITRVANVTNLDTVGIPVVNTYRPNSRSISVSQGKGLTLAAAKASGVMEALELFVAERPSLPLRRASHDDLRRQNQSVIDVWNLPRLARSSFSDRIALSWVEGVDLGNDGPRRWVPFDIVHTDWTMPLVSGSEMFLISTNGLASGNSFAEAVSHAICELVERDATTLWYCQGDVERKRSRIANRTIQDESCRVLLDNFERAGVMVGVWETTTDVGFSSFHCMTTERDKASLRRAPSTTGHGCHPSPRIALSRALTEAAQKRLTMITGARDDLPRSQYAKRVDAAYEGRVLDLIRESEGARSFADAPSMTGPSAEDEVQSEIASLAALGLTQVVAVDLTPKDAPFVVVRVIIPGLEGMHDMEGYVPGARAKARLGEQTP